MADVFISYGRPDRPFVEKLADALRTAGLTVWYDRNLTLGDEFSKEIEAEARAAGCGVVVWSKTSVSRQWVRSEAQLCRQLGKLVPVRVEDCDIPLPFNGLHTEMLPPVGDIDLNSPAISAIKAQAQKAVEAVGAKRRTPPIGPDLIRQLLIERAMVDPDSPGDFIETHRLNFEDLKFYPRLVGKLNWRGQASASIGYDRKEEYTEDIEKPAPDGKGKITVKEKKTRTVTTWTPHAAPLSGGFEVSLPATDDVGIIAQALNEFDPSTAMRADELPEGAEIVQPLAKPFEHAPNQQFITAEIMAQATAMLPGDKKRDVNVSPILDSSEVTLLYLPIWSAQVAYGDKTSPMLASALDGGDTIYDMPKDATLLADRDSREGSALMALGSGVTAAGTGAADVWLAQTPALGAAALAGLAFIAATVLAKWPFKDRRLARTIFERERDNAARRNAAAAAAGVDRPPVTPPVDDSGLGIIHVLSWLVALGGIGIGAHFAYQAWRHLSG